MAKLKTQIKYYFLINGLYSLARSLPQAVLTPILVTKGLNYSDILIVQTVFSMVTIILEFPSGYLSDYFSKKFTYLSSILMMMISYAIVFSCNGLLMMALAWSFYGWASALQSATMDYHFIEKIRGRKTILKSFFSADKNIILSASILSALLSTWLFGALGQKLYIISLFFFCLALLLGFLLLPDDTSNRHPTQHAHSFFTLAQEIKTACATPELMLLVFVASTGSIAMIPFFQLWQMIFLDDNLPPTLFGLFFIIFQLCNMTANFLFPHIPETQWFFFSTLGALLACGLIILSPSTTLRLLAILFIPIPLFLYTNQADVRLQKAIPSPVMSSIGSLSGTVSSAIGLAATGLCSLLSYTLPPKNILALFLVAFSITATGAWTMTIKHKNNTSPNNAPLTPELE